MATESYVFGASTFVNFVWLRGGSTFENPRLLEVEMITAGDYTVEVLDPLENLVAKGIRRDNPNGGWATFDFRGGGGEFVPPVPDGSYKIRLVNLGSGTRRVRGGVLTMTTYGHPWERWLPAMVNAIRRFFR